MIPETDDSLTQRPPRRWWHLATVDVTPLRRHRDFRLLFIGRFVSFYGSMITTVAFPYQVYELTHSVLLVGALGVLEFGAIFSFAFVGGALGGVLVAAFGLSATYLVDVGTFLVGLACLTLMRAVPPPVDAERPSLRRVIEGLRYARSRQELIGTYVVDMVAMFFGMPLALFPAIAQGLGGPRVLGLLYAAPAVGSFLFSATSGWTNNVHRHGMGVIVAAVVWGVAIIGFGLSPVLWLALAFLALAGAADMMSGVFRSVIWNQTIPDSLRGRLASIEMLSYTSGPALGNFEAGLVASIFNVRVSVVSGGVLCVIGCVLCAAALPLFRKYDARLYHAAPDPLSGSVKQEKP